MTETLEEEILQWAMLPGGNAPPEGVPDLNALLGVATNHRVVGRLRARLEKELPPGVPRLFVSRLRFAEHHARTAFREQIAYATDFAARFGTPEIPIIFLKGFGTYALTGSEERKRAVGDFDIIASDLPALYDTLLANGFSGKRHFTHEYGKLSGGGATIDLHEYFPVRGYPVQNWDIDRAALSPPAGQEPFALADLPPDFERHEIRYDDILPDAQRGIAPDTQGLTFPSPEMACLILCAHAFRDGTEKLHYLSTEQQIRLGELLDIQTLAQSPRFDCNRFTALTQQYGVGDAVAWTARQCERFFGETALPRLPGASRRVAHTVEHLPLGGWLFLNEPGLGLRSGEETLARLGAQTVGVDEGETVILPEALLRGVIPLQISTKVRRNRGVLHLSVKCEPKTDTFHMLFLHNRALSCHYESGTLTAHEYKDLADETFVVPVGAPTLDAATNETRIALRLPPEGLGKIPAFCQCRTAAGYAYLPLILRL